MILINGSRVDWLRYDFAVRTIIHGREIIYRGDTYDEARSQADAIDGELIMRTVYATGWRECFDGDNNDWRDYANPDH